MCTHRGGLNAMRVSGNPTVTASVNTGGASRYANYDPNADYRNNGIPHAFQQELRADGWNMDASAVMRGVPFNAEVELYDVQTGETAVYRRERRSLVARPGTTQVSYELVSGGIDYIGRGARRGAGATRLPNGIVARRRGSSN